jgi:hypothetical protein
MFFCLLLAIPTIMLGQIKMDSDDSDAAALQQKLASANTAKMDLSGPFGKACAAKKMWRDDSARMWCDRISSDYNSDPSLKELILLRGCSLPNETGAEYPGPCERLVGLYKSQHRYIEALAVLKSPNYLDPPDERLFGFAADQRVLIYRILGNKQGELTQVRYMCLKLSNTSACSQLQSRFGEQVDLDSVAAKERRNEAFDQEEQAAKKETDNYNKEYASQSKAALDQTISDAITNGTASTQPTREDSGGQQSASSMTTSSPNPAQSGKQSQSCRDMTACVKVVSSTYDANHFLHVVVKNTCGSQIRITTSVYAQNRSCTVGQTSNFSPGDSQDMGSLTDRNWYQFQADDSVRSSVDGSGCKLMIANSCDR